MGYLRNLVLAGALAAIGLAPASAQFGPPMLSADSTVVEELIVRAYGGPPWWRVSDADSTVYILAAPSSLPPGVEFDASTLERRLNGANLLILPPEMNVGPMVVLALPGAISLVNEVRNKSGRSAMEPTLTAAERARFRAARERYDRPETRYGALKPGVAAMMLAGDVATILNEGQSKTTPDEEGVSIMGLARDAAVGRKVRVQPAARYGAKVLADAVGDLRHQRLTPCFNVALESIERGDPGPRANARPNLAPYRAWTEGDVAPLIALRRASNAGPGFARMVIDEEGGMAALWISDRRCAEAIPTIARMQERWVADETAAVRAALRRRGHSVAVLEIDPLLQTGGVLDRLRREGFTVRSPGEPDPA